MEQTEHHAAHATNDLQLQNPTFLQLRLDTRPLIKEIELFLSAKRTVLIEDKKTGEIYEEEREVGKPLANSEGITAILNFVNLRANHHVVQGNFNREEYYWLVSDTRKELAMSIILNCLNWGIEDNKLDFIIDSILGFIKPFLSRLVDNEERKSYLSQFSSREVLTDQKPKRSAMGEFANGFK